MKRWLSVLLTLCLCVGLMLPAAAADTEDVTVPTDYWTDEGNYKMPSIDAETRTVSITSAAELAWVAYRCMHGTTFAEYTILLENDIDLSGHLWMPIGVEISSGSYPFQGVFDGEGHQITGLTISDLATGKFPYKSGSGLFGVVEEARIQNVLVDGVVSAKSNGGRAMLIGYLYNSVLLNCGVTGRISAKAAARHVLVGIAYSGTVYNCFANCETDNQSDLVDASIMVLNCWYPKGYREPNYKNSYAVSTSDGVDYAAKLNEVMIEGAAKWVIGSDGYPALDFNNRVQNWGDAAEPISPADGVYYIDKPEQLAYIAKIVNEGNTLEGQTVLLRNDLDLSGKSWVPIGREKSVFSGEMNGNGHRITGLATPYNSDGYLNGYIGLVGHAGETAFLHDLSIDGDIFTRKSWCGLALGKGDPGSHIKRCTVTGSVSAKSYLGGVAGQGFAISQCEARALTLTTRQNSDGGGGICGGLTDRYYNSAHYNYIYPNISECISSGTMQGQYNLGGILSSSLDNCTVRDCFSSMTITAKEGHVGGISTYAGRSLIKNCYYIGSITAKESTNCGLIAGQPKYYGTSDPTGCYWSDECGMTIDGLPASKRGVGTDVSEDPTTGLTLTEMRTKASYAGWDFDTIWAIDTNKNGGLPYLRWQDDVPTVIEPTSLTLSAETVTLAAGRSTTLTAVFSPIGAGGKPTWSSDAPDVASVTAGGQVAAHRAGTAIITASYGSLQASCSVTVTERSSDEYTIREITLKDASGKAVTGIPSDSFWAYVSVTKGANAKDATVLLASYDRNGQYLGLTALEADVPCGTTYRLGAWFANADRRVAKVKAFVVDGVGTMRPLAAAAEIS